MSLLDAAVQLQGSRGPRCSFAIAYDQHPDLSDEIDELLAAVKARRVYGNTAAKILQAHDIPVKGETVLRHVNAECSCPH